MPIYEYSCRKCGAHLEVMQKISDKPLARHAECGGKLEKQWSQTSFQFKGAGWYVTDYAGKGKEKKEGAETKNETTKSESTESKKTTAAESKPAESKSAESKSAESKAAKPSASTGD